MDILSGMLKQRLDHTGERISLTDTKPTLIKQVKVTHKDCLLVFYYHYFLNKYVAEVIVRSLKLL